MRSLRFSVVAGLLAGLMITAAEATVVPTPPPPAAVPPSATSSSSSKAEAGAFSSSGAAAGASSDQDQAQKQGQGQGQGQSQTGGNLSNNSRSNFYALPAPVFTPPMAAVACPAPRIENRAFSLGWGFISMARGDTITDDCTLLTISNAYVEQCQYARAQKVRDKMANQKLLGLDLPPDTVLLDLPAERCALLKLPPAPVTNVYHNDYSVHHAAPACPKGPVPKKRPAKKAQACKPLI